MKRENILTLQVNITNLTNVLENIENWLKNQVSHYICVSNVHMCMETYDSSEFCEIINNADMVIPDGKPLALGLKLLGHEDAQQVRGADVTLAICKKAEQMEWVIGLYGGSEQVLVDFKQFLQTQFPSIKIACAISPPFRELTDEEDQAFITQINQAGVQILFVGLGCPKQEQWMAVHKGKVNSVMLGVGAVFDFLSGNKKEAPRWVQSIGMEWLFRLISEPRRLWKRYLKHNPRFIVFFGWQLLRHKGSGKH